MYRTLHCITSGIHMLKNMQESSKEWNISFAGCGFLMAYYCGVYSCLFERAPFLLKGVKKICGASSGALMGAILACQMSPAKSCENLLEMSREARKGTLGAVHPSFDLLKIVRNFLNHDLPEDAHLLASGRLFVSLTRVSDGTNVLVSEFDSKEDLIQALICSCFYPLYCGVIPPRYHGIRYVDGALSDNMPFSGLRNTITISPFSGESDISPYGSPFYFHDIYYNNVSIHINFINAHRVVIAFFPPDPEVLAEMCQRI
ncbi:patatin-like phospholipase domain-containing protein 2 [Cyprinus carpio]|uniref:triacylglycerol lipase n=1 Tax=Cyprinus carpio TaxID=7962 RepID=A0A9Q9XWQ5_CYPCA|nr:patatin-like phospholipase domain-containing protein 2 [Cyprinus carpio]